MNPARRWLNLCRNFSVGTDKTIPLAILSINFFIDVFNRLDRICLSLSEEGGGFFLVILHCVPG